MQIARRKKEEDVLCFVNVAKVFSARLARMFVREQARKVNDVT
jgi:hypothetical protein